MATTYTLIDSEVLSASAASVTFSSIPATFTDLVVRISARDDQTVVFQSIQVEFNNDSSLIYSITNLKGNGSAATSARFSGIPYTIDSSGTNGNSATSNTFSNTEIYIPNYTSTTSKPFSTFSVAENNATSAGITAMAGLYANSSAITSIKFDQNGGSDWLSGSSFYLYGISNA